jgi:hypothetical protein
MIKVINANDVLPQTMEPIKVSYRAGKFSIWMRVLKNGSLTRLPRRIDYIGTFFITRGDETFMYSLPAEETELTLTSFVKKLNSHCTKFQYSELPAVLQAKLV